MGEYKFLVHKRVPHTITDNSGNTYVHLLRQYSLLKAFANSLQYFQKNLCYMDRNISLSSVHSLNLKRRGRGQIRDYGNTTRHSNQLLHHSFHYFTDISNSFSVCILKRLWITDLTRICEICYSNWLFVVRSQRKLERNVKTEQCSGVVTVFRPGRPYSLAYYLSYSGGDALQNKWSPGKAGATDLWWTSSSPLQRH